MSRGVLRRDVLCVNSSSALDWIVQADGNPFAIVIRHDGSDERE